MSKLMTVSYIQPGTFINWGGLYIYMGKGKAIAVDTGVQGGGIITLQHNIEVECLYPEEVIEILKPEVVDEELRFRCSPGDEWVPKAQKERSKKAEKS